MANDKEHVTKSALEIESQNVIDFREMGATGLKRFSGFVYEEFLTELTGWKGLAIYKEMRSNDSTVAAVLFAIRMLCRRAPWRVEPASKDPEDQLAAEFLKTCMDDMSQTWIDTIDEILSSMLPFGHAVDELVYKRRCGEVEDASMRSKYCDGRIGWRKIAIRSSDTIYRWMFDDNGGIRGIEQLAPPHYQQIVIPIEKLLLFRTTIEKNNPEGVSILRGAYRSWYMKKNIENIEAIGIERDLAGLPMAFVPPEIMSKNATPEEKAVLAEVKSIVTNVKRNAQEGIVFPMLYDAAGKQMYDFKLLSTGGTRQFDTSAIINRYDQRIAMTALADFVLLGQEKVGSFALASSKTNIFSSAIGAFLDIIADVFNRYAIPRLFALNDFMISEHPTITHGDIGSVDLNELGQYIQRLAQAGMPLFPNAELEKYLLEVAGAPSSAPVEEGTPDIPVEANQNEIQDEVSIPSTSDSTVPIGTNEIGAVEQNGPVTNASGNIEDQSIPRNPNQ